MSRTYRKQTNKYYRSPKTKNELTQIDAIEHDPDLKEYNLSKRNRMNRHIPNAWDDIPVAAHDEYDWNP